MTQKRAFMPLYIVSGQQRACMPVYIGKSGDLVGWHRCLTDTQTTEYRATQLLSSIQFKLSHAIWTVFNLIDELWWTKGKPFSNPGFQDGAIKGTLGHHNFWFIVLDDLWSKKSEDPEWLFDQRCYIHLKWSIINIMKLMMAMIRPTPAAMNVRPITVSGMPNVVPMIVIIQTFGKNRVKYIIQTFKKKNGKIIFWSIMLDCLECTNFLFKHWSVKKHHHCHRRCITIIITKAGLWPVRPSKRFTLRLRRSARKNKQKRYRETLRHNMSS